MTADGMQRPIRRRAPILRHAPLKRRQKPIQRHTRPARVGRRTREWQAFRRRYLKELRAERGEIVCERCGLDPGTLDLHHVIKRSVAPRLVLEASNVQLLCRRCHAAEHGR